MHKLKNRKQILKKIRELKKERHKLPRFSAFGNDNWKELDGKIADLKDCLTMDEATIRAKVRKIETEHDSPFYNSEEGYEELRKKIDAFDWVLGDLVDL